jgi:hypothetical protein
MSALAFEISRQNHEKPPISVAFHLHARSGLLADHYAAMQDAPCCYANKSIAFDIWYT